MAHRSDSMLRSISTTRLSSQHHLWYAKDAVPTRLYSITIASFHFDLVKVRHSFGS